MKELHPGDCVVATVRRLGQSIYDRIWMYDMTTDDVYRERGINLWQGWLSRLLTHRINGLEIYREIAQLLTRAKEAVTIVVDLAKP